MKQNNNIDPKETRVQETTITPEELENLTKGTSEKGVADQTPLEEKTSKEQDSSKGEPEEDDSDTAMEGYYEEETSRPVATAGKAIIVTLGVVILVLLLLLLCNNARKTGGDTTTSPNNNGGNIVTTIGGGNNGENPTVTTSGSGNEATTPKFDIDAFIASIESAVRNNQADELAIADASNYVRKLGEDKLKELIAKYGELKVQKAIADVFSYAIDIRAKQYAESKGLTYSIDPMSDWYDYLDEINEEYLKATGKNAEGALMSLKDYDAYKESREAIKALITKSGDKDLLTWYEKRTSSWDECCKAQKDTEAIEAFKESTRLELLSATPTNFIKFIEFQLEQNINGTGSEYENLIRDYGYLLIGNN